MPEPGGVPEDVAAVPENAYGSRKRIDWIVRHLRRTDIVLEVGCGTGYMICRPLARLGYDVHGIDIDAASVERGQALPAKRPRPRDPRRATALGDRPRV